MEMPQEDALPGSRTCVGCHGLTFRRASDGLCPRCAFEAEHLIERIEIDSLNRDLALITEFEAYYQKREEHRLRLAQIGGPVFPPFEPYEHDQRTESPFSRDSRWREFRHTG